MSDSSSPRPKVFVALPCYGDVSGYFARALTQFIEDADFDIVVRWGIGDSLVSRARNVLTADFLETDCTHLLWVDTDLIFSAEQVKKMLAHEVPLVGGFYPKKQDGPLAWVCNSLPDAEEADENGLQRVRYIGTGFMLIQRELIETVRMMHPELEYRSDGSGRAEWDLWRVGVHAPSGRYLSEDWWFCQMVLDLGVPVFGDVHVILKHMGFAIYPLSHQQGDFLPVPRNSTETAACPVPGGEAGAPP